MYVFYIFILVSFLLGFPAPAVACEMCTLPRLGRDTGELQTEKGNKKWFAKYMFEEQNWHEKEAREAHNLHHAGHHFHDKTREESHHFTLGNRLTPDFILQAELPYVIRHSIEIDDHSILGAKQKSQGIGDLRLVGDYRVFRGPKGSVGVIGGVKFPTGSTRERNTDGTRFEPELQPGSGSFDYLTGLVFQKQENRVSLTANSIYVFKTEGDQDFEFGDVVSASLLADYLLNPQQQTKTRLGLDANIQYEQKQKDTGVKVTDSGGTTLLLGPVLSLSAHEHILFAGSFLAPVYQNLGGVHQELDFVWTLSGKIFW